MCLLEVSLEGGRMTSWFVDFLVGFLGDMSEVWGWEHRRRGMVMEMEMSIFKTVSRIANQVFRGKVKF
jgi:hypothetical protein